MNNQNNQINNQIDVNPIEQTTKNFIIGKLWTTSQDGLRAGSLKINRDLPKNIVLKPNATLYLHKNQQREGKMDADYSVSVLLPTAVTEKLIALTQESNKDNKSVTPISS